MKVEDSTTYPPGSIFKMHAAQSVGEIILAHFKNRLLKGASQNLPFFIHLLIMRKLSKLIKMGCFFHLTGQSSLYDVMQLPSTLGMSAGNISADSRAR